MKNISHVIFVAYQPLTCKFKNDFYIERLIKEDFKTGYWDLSGIFDRHESINEEISEVVQVKINNYQQLKKRILQHRDFSLFIFDITYSAKTYKVFRIFSRQNCITGFFARGSLPVSSESQSFSKRFVSKFKAFRNIQYLRITILNQLAILARRIQLIKPYTFIFYAGTQGMASIGYGYKYGLESSRLIAVNSFDYDKYLLLTKEDRNEINECYCVFLDVYLPYHPDLDLFGLPKVDAGRYYASLNNFFTNVERNYKIKVVIAAHPKSDYEKKKCYGARTVIKNKTAELVQHAEFVLTHASSSVSFAVLFKKPILFIYTNAIKEVYPYTHYTMILYFSKLLKAACINIDAAFAGNNILTVDEDAYTQYEYNFLTNSQSEQEFSDNIFMKTLKNIQSESLKIN